MQKYQIQMLDNKIHDFVPEILIHILNHLMKIVKKRIQPQSYVQFLRLHLRLKNNINRQGLFDNYNLQY